MSLGWDSLPLLPLRCIMEHLSTEDALAAMTVCRHWHATILLYEGHKETVKLHAKQLEKSMFLTRLFRKHTKRLHIYLDCNDEELDKFMNYVLPQYFDSMKLHEILFIGPNYLQQNQNVPVVKLKRIITESLVFKHLHCIQKLALIGCEMDTVKNESDRYTHKHVEYYSRPLSFSSASSPADAVLSSCNTNMMLFSTLQHIMVDYEHISTEALQTLSHLTMFSHLTLNICNKRRLTLTPIDWHLLHTCYPNGLDVSLNIIALPYRKLNDVMENVLVEGLALTSLKVLFCKTLYTPLLTHVVAVHKSTLRELVWADCPSESTDPYHRVIQPVRQPEYDMCNVNPFILLCWQCTQLRRLVIHGYWIWQYDILGFVRLRKTLEQLTISSIYNERANLNGHDTSDNILRVLAGDTPTTADHGFVQQVNEYTEFTWRPVPWSSLHAALRARSSGDQRADYVLQEAGVTSRPEQRRQQIQELRQ